MVVGNGNVVIDVARILVLDPSELAPTDTTDHAIDAFGVAGVLEVVLLARRGPVQVAFTNPELRELGKLRRADVIVDPAQLGGVSAPEPDRHLRRRHDQVGVADGLSVLDDEPLRPRWPRSSRMS